MDQEDLEEMHAESERLSTPSNDESLEDGWEPVYDLGGVDEEDNGGHRFVPEKIEPDASSLKFLKKNNINHEKPDD